MNVNDEASGYEAALREAAEMWGANQGETTAWARCSLASLVSGSISPLELAQSVYGWLKPVDAHGRPVAPKLKNGRLSVRNLENSTRPVQGASAARVSLEAVLLIYMARELIGEENYLHF